MSEPEFLPIATVAKPHGIRGEVRIVCSPEHLEFLVELPLVRVAGRELQIEDVRGDSSSPIVAFATVEDRSAAEALRGATIEALRADMPMLGDDEFYLADLEGCDVRAAGNSIGTVTSAVALPANAVLTIRLHDGIASSADRDLLAPFTRDAVPSVDIDERQIEIDAAFLGLEL